MKTTFMPFGAAVTAAVAAAAAILLPQTAARAQAKKAAPPPAKKTPAKKTPAKKTPPAATDAPKTVVLGTTQLPGDFGQMGTTYTIGKRDPLNFTLKSAEYSAAPLTLGGQSYVPSADQKLLILRYIVHNPQPREVRYSWSALTFTAVDARDVNHSFFSTVSREGDTLPLMISLKPAQKIDVYAAALVPAEGPVPKLMVEREKGAPVIRYDLRGKAQPLPAPYADPADTSGTTALREVPVTMSGAYFPLGMYDIKMENIADDAGPLGGAKANPGRRLVTALVSLRNRSPLQMTYNWSRFAVALRDADGEKTKGEPLLLHASRNETVLAKLAPGEEVRVRFVFQFPEKAEAKSFTIAESGPDKRALVFPLPALP